MANETFVDYYTVLEVSPDADQAVIRASYMRLARLRHPDRNLDNPEATLLFQLVRLFQLSLVFLSVFVEW